MPLLLEKNIHSGIRAGVWNITETADELLNLVQLSDVEMLLLGSYKHDLRKRQWLAYRALLKNLLAPESPSIFYDENGKPGLVTGSHQISVSHAGHLAAAVCSSEVPVGIDVEKITGRIERVAERFLTALELESVPVTNRLEYLYVMWGAKEAIYKLYGKPGVDFRNDIIILPFDYICNTMQPCTASLSADGKTSTFTLCYWKEGDSMVVVAY